MTATPIPDRSSAADRAGAAGVVPFLEVQDLAASPGRAPLLAGITLRVARGGRAALLGPSGCGKTTLLRCIAGLAEPTRGSIRVDGRVVAGEGISVPPDRRGVALVFQNYALWPHMTAREQVRFSAGDPRRTGVARETADAWLERLRIAPLGDRLPGQLSGGEQARLALARAFATGAPLLLLDEPMRNLDPHLAHDLRAEMAHWIAASGLTMLLVTHEPRDAFALCDSLHVLMSGRLAASGAPEEVWRRPPDDGVARLLGGGTPCDAMAPPGSAALLAEARP